METRKNSRVPVQFKITFQIDSNDKRKFNILRDNILEASIINISILGIGIIVKYFFPKGLNIDLEIDGRYFGLEYPMNIKGEIRYCKYIKNNGYRCGVKFLDIKKEYLEKIEDFIASYDRREAPRLKLLD